MKIFKNLAVSLCTCILFSCSDAAIENSWVQPVPGQPGTRQGFTLKADGSASSINMATLKYERWEREGDLLFLFGTSVGNHRNIAFTDTLTIKKLTSDSLILKKGDMLLRYSVTDVEPDVETLADSSGAAAEKILSVKGKLVMGHEVRSFTAEGDTCDYWIVDETGELTQRYDELTKGVKNGMPVHVELEVVDMGKSDDGFAADYAGVYRVMKINKIIK